MAFWTDHTPSRRCTWIDQLRGWAVLVMIEVHCLTVWLAAGLLPNWLNYINGLVAPSFILCAGYSLVLSTFRADGTLRPFAPTARRLAFILFCGFLLHAPGLRLVDITLLNTPQRLRELFTFDVLHCIAVSLLILQGLARLVRRPRPFAVVALILGVAVAWLAPHLWAPGVADGWWMPVRGLINGNPDHGVRALFPLFPWLSFAAFGSVLGVLYRELRVMSREGRAPWSEAQWLVGMTALGLVLILWAHLARGWLWHGGWPPVEAARLHNTTLPSVLQRAGVALLVGALLGTIEHFRGRWPGPNWVESASRESLLIYVLHLLLIFRFMLGAGVRAHTGWEWHSQGWGGSLGLTALVTAVSLAAGLFWQRLRQTPARLARLTKIGALVAGVYFIFGGWLTVSYFMRHPDEAHEPYLFIDWARTRKGLPPLPDDLGSV